MSLALVLAVAVAAAIGYAVVTTLWPRTAGLRRYRWLVAALACGVGLGITAVSVFVWLSLFGLPDRRLVAIELAVLGLVAVGLRRRQREPNGPTSAEGGNDVGSGHLDRVIALAFGVTLACAMAAFLGMSISRPHGAWDAWMNWNLRARMIFRAGPDWQVTFSPLLHWSHPDYPLLVQTSVVRTWVYHGAETLAGPVTVAFLFTFGTVGLAVAGLTALRDRSQGFLAGLTLLGTPFLLFHGISQYGDVPVGFFFLATMVLLALHDRHRESSGAFALLAGLATGLAAWTKNEGLLFLGAIVLASLLTMRRAGGVRGLARDAGPYLLGLLPLLVVIAYFKLRLAPPNDLMSSVGTGETLARLADPQRYAALVKAYATGIASFGFNGLISGVALLALYGVCLGVRPEEVGTRWFRMTAWTVALMLAGHAVVIIATAADAARLLNSSLERLMLQLWPVVVFACFRVFRSPYRMVEAAIGSRARMEGAA